MKVSLVDEFFYKITKFVMISNRLVNALALWNLTNFVIFFYTVTKFVKFEAKLLKLLVLWNLAKSMSLFLKNNWVH